jgi:hypothetical protein
MASGRSLHIGLNSVDPNHYGGWSGPLVACEADAHDMGLIAHSRGFATKTLLTAAATRDAVLQEIAAAASASAPGDIFVLTNSSHGGQVPDQNGDEDDGTDETWCMYDGELIDDEIYFALSAFQAGVRILVISDSCHSGSSIKSPELRAIYGDMLAHQAVISGLASRSARLGASLDFLGPLMSMPRPKTMPVAIMNSTYFENKAFYDGIAAREELKDAKSAVKASAILLSGCQDNQTSMDGAFNGAFTGELKMVWNGGQFRGGYEAFLTEIRSKLPPTQSPNYFRVGALDPAFEKQSPFTI